MSYHLSFDFDEETAKQLEAMQYYPQTRLAWLEMKDGSLKPVGVELKLNNANQEIEFTHELTWQTK